MATLPVYTVTGQPAGEIELAAEVFGVEPNAALMHQAVVATLAGRRQGSADSKTRAEVKHTTRKLFRQKGTGRARQGMRSAPHWKGGGVAFGPHPRDFSKDLTKKMRRKALLCALSAKVQADAVRVIDAFAFDTPKTKQAVMLLNALGIAEKKIIVVFAEPTEAEVLSFCNLPKVILTTVDMLGTYDTLVADYLLFTRASLEAMVELKQQPLGAARWMAKQQGGVA